MDENYQTYLNRAMRLTLPETYQSQVQHLQESAKFLPDSTGRQPAPFPGFSIITPPASEDRVNQTLYSTLADYQQKIVQALGENLFVPVPPESFHLTLADLIWDSNYRLASEANANFDAQLQAQIAEIFQQSQALTEQQGIQLQILGLMLMPRAIAVCVVPTEEQGYDRLLKFRRAIYQNRDLIGLGVEQQYYFTPHITLGYFGDVPTEADFAQLSHQFENLNQQWLNKDPQTFWVHQAELRKFDNMTHFYRQADWAALQF